MSPRIEYCSNEDDCCDIISPSHRKLPFSPSQAGILSYMGGNKDQGRRVDR